MPEWTLHEWLMVALPVVAIVIALLAWRRPRQRNDFSIREATKVMLYPEKEFPVIHATNGVPTLQQLMDGIEVNSKERRIAERLYEAGLAQFNHDVNNRDGLIEMWRQQMANLAKDLSESEVALAGGIGTSMASDGDDDHRKKLQAQYDDLTPQAQIYTQHKRKEIDALRRIARDLEKSVTRTDYTSVKARIACGSVTLDSVMSELPVFWQNIRTVNQRAQRSKPRRKPPKRNFLHVRFMLEGEGLLEDNHAEKDGDWIVSSKHGLTVPYQEPIGIYEQMEWDKPPVRTGEVVVINQDPTSEWETEFWRQGGRLDQVYLRAKNGLSPEQLRSAYRRRLIRNIGWGFAGVATLVNIAIIMERYL